MSAIDHTIPVRDGHGFDAGQLEAYLRSRIAKLEGPLSIRQFRGGQSNPTFLLVASTGKALVLRKKPPGVLLPSAHQVEREFRIMHALAGTDVPVPHMHLLCEDAAVIGTPFYVMDFVEGRIMRDTAQAEIDAADRREIYLEMARVLARLHRVNLAAANLSDYGKPGDYFRRQIGRWGRQVDANAPPEARALIAWLEANVPPEQGPTIVHGDFRLENLVFAPDRPKVLAVLDWELSTLGDPMADLAYNCLPFRLPSRLKGLGGLADKDIGQLGIPDEAEYVAAYCAATGRPPIDHWNFYLAFSLFRTSAILQGVYERAQANNAASVDALEVGGAFREVAQIGLSIAHGPSAPRR